jgi:hypothetical protein
MNTEVIEIKQAEVLRSMESAEVDVQISTAMRYPMHQTRDQINAIVEQIATIATLDPETAESCFYVMQRGKGADRKVIEGVSVRLAEIIAHSWGNLRIQTRIVGNDGRFVTAQGICHDLERNVAYSATTSRRITDKYGKTYTDDMQVVTSNAAAAIAMRNAIMKAVPMAIVKRAVKEIRDVALGKATDLQTRIQRMFTFYEGLGVAKQEILNYLGVKSSEGIDREMVFNLLGLAQAIKEGDTTVNETFRHNTAAAEDMAAKAKKEAEERKRRVEDAMAASQGKPAATKEVVDESTGEVIQETEQASAQPQTQSNK